MSFLHTAFSLKKDGGAARKSTSSETSDGVFGEETAADFWPVQHPIEPPQGETPVQCPMPNSSLINEWRVSRSFQRKVGVEPTSKRRHSVSHDGDHRLLFHNKSQSMFRTSNASSSSRLINKPDPFQFQFRRY